MNESTSKDVNICSTDSQYNLVGTTRVARHFLTALRKACSHKGINDFHIMKFECSGLRPLVLSETEPVYSTPRTPVLAARGAF